jgi:hypothetical protein
MNSEQVFQDLMGEGSSVTQDITPPYSSEATLDEKFNSLYKALRRSIKLKSRTSSLINAYFLGKLINDIETSTLQYRYKQKLTSHYVTMIDYTFDLFEYLPAHIYITKFLTVQTIRRMKRSAILEVRNKIVDHLAGAPNLEGEDC